MLELLCNNLQRKEIYELMIHVRNEASFEGYKRGKYEIQNGLKKLLDIV